MTTVTRVNRYRFIEKNNKNYFVVVRVNEIELVTYIKTYKLLLLLLHRSLSDRDQVINLQYHAYTLSS